MVPETKGVPLEQIQRHLGTDFTPKLKRNRADI
jgi:hypothetical protein